MKARKTRDAWYLMVNYGQGWEHEVTEYDRAEARARLREYRENCPEYASRLIRKRERLALEEGSSQ